MPLLECSNLTKTFRSARAVDEVSFAVEPGEFFSLLGPSGSGKTTTLRLVAGLETADQGQVRIGGRLVNDLPAHARRLGMVFQQYALFPHLTVERNVAYGLERRSLARDELAARVRKILELVALAPERFASRRPAELSGGERQRVALARALVLDPELLLLDEPLGALDLALRKAMQLELRALNRTLGVTFLHVTHDQEEALTMSDRLAVMNHGRIVQIGTPKEIYERPRTEFVARFIGESNVLTDSAGRRISVRPERVEVLPATSAVNDGIPGVVEDALYQGERLRILLSIPSGERLIASVPNDGRETTHLMTAGSKLVARWRPEDAWPLESGS